MRLGIRCLIASTLCCTYAVAQAPPAPSGATLKVSSRLTLVDITVTDSKGHPVQGLTQADFSVKEDGKPQPLKSFQEYGEGRPGADKPVAAPAALKLPPNFYTNFQPAAPAATSVNVLLIDDLSTSQAERSLAITQARDYVKTMPRGTRVAVLELASSLRTVQWFTSDPDILLAALNTGPPKMVVENAALSEGMVIVPKMGGILPPHTQLGPANIPGEGCSNQDMRNRMTLDALDAIAVGVSGIKGRKNLLWFTDGVSSLVFPIASRPSATDCPKPDYTKDLNKAYGLLAEAQVAIYPIDPRGLLDNPANEAVNSAGCPPLPRCPKNSGPAFTRANSAFLKGMADDQDSLEAIAKATGGIAHYNENNLTQALGEAVQNGSDYYTVSYVPPGVEFDGKYHKIEVSVDRPDVHLKYREGYTADDFGSGSKSKPDTSSSLITLTTTTPPPGAVQPAYQNEMHAAMAHGADTSRQLPFDVRVQPAPPSASTSPIAMPVSGSHRPAYKGKSTALVRYEFLYLLPADEIAFTDNPDGAGGIHKGGSLEFDIAAYDAAGDLVSGQSQTAKLTLNKDETQKFGAAPFQYTQQLDLPPGALFVRVGIRDDVSHKLGTLEIPLTVASTVASTVAH